VILYPAIDIMGGKAVRLIQGRFDDDTVYNDDPVAAARKWAEDGARFLHVIDLEGARAGAPAALGELKRIVEEIGLPVQFGGGMRSLPSVRDALRAGADRVIIGTAAFTDGELLDELLRAWPERIVVSVDVRGGRVATGGWTETTQMEPGRTIERLQARGVRSFVYSNIDRDGMLEGPDPAEVLEIAQIVRGRFIYSGGIGTVADLESLAALRQVNLAGVIVGKALYEGRFTIAQGQAALEEHHEASVGRVRRQPVSRD
jgi:phosphoribosylformimino-5-aminoimidazole carboxamide ribotide isomerase